MSPMLILGQYTLDNFSIKIKSIHSLSTTWGATVKCGACRVRHIADRVEPSSGPALLKMAIAPDFI